MDSELLSFQAVGYSYPNGERLAGRFPAMRREAVSDLTVSVAAGRAIALLGGNGAGKSTFLQLCDGLLAPDSGTISWQGRPMDRSRAGLSRLRSDVGIVFQDPDDQLFAGTLFQDVAFGPVNQGLERQQVRERVESALGKMGLSDYAELPPHVLSHGMRKRAALAGVLATNPRLLLLDEPTAGLDPDGESSLLAVLTDLVEQGATVVLSTHDLELARTWARDAMVLDRGRLAAVGPVERILSNRGLLEETGLRRRSRGRTVSVPDSTGSSGIVVASTGSGVGKTSIACGILRALRRRGVDVRAAKTGPDYLDPMWLERASGGICQNLDPWMAGAEGVRELAAGNGLLVVETAMGLYDGIRSDSDEGSGFEVSRILELPVLLVVDASGSARTVAAVVEGMAEFGPAAVAGVVANRVGSAAHADLVGRALASKGLPPLVGYVMEGALPAMPERHLGLVPPGGDDGIVDRLADAVEATVDLDLVRGLTRPLPSARKTESVNKDGEGLRLGLSWDEAFRFAYAPVIDRLRARGVEIVRFSPLAEGSLPPDLDGLWICGGYPEVNAAALEANRDMRESVSGFCRTGNPVLAECGGLLYLATEIVDHAGVRHAMCGVVPAIGRMGDRLRSLGYRTATAREDLFVAARGASLRGHEFHYGTLEGRRDGIWRHAFDLEGSRGTIGPEGWWNGSVLATWFHGWLRAGNSLDRWIAAMREARARRME